jgi:hypothetical protein
MFAAWIEAVVGLPTLEMVAVEGHASPGVAASLNLGGGVNPRDPSIALRADNTLLVVWAAGSPGEIHGQRLSTDLELEGSALSLSTTPAVAAVRPRVAASADRFAVVWEENGEVVMLTILGPDGTVPAAPARIASGGVSVPVIAPDLNGGFAIAYQTATAVELIRISADGIPRGAPLVFPAAQHPELAAIPEGGLIIAYLAAGTVRLARIGCGP